MLGHAIAGLPNEACGLFAGEFGGDRVERFFPMTNTASSSRIYQLDSAEIMSVERAADDIGLAVIGLCTPTPIRPTIRRRPMWLTLLDSIRLVCGGS